MRFALIGPDEDALKLARAISNSDSERLVAVYEAGPYAQPLQQLSPLAAQDRHWEELLHGTVADVVIVGRGGPMEQRVEQLRKLAQASIATLAVHPACESITGYELDMIRRDTGGVLQAYLPGRSHPAFTAALQLARHGDDSPIGPIEQIVILRRGRLADRQQVLDQFARDAYLAQSLIGELVKVNALGAAGDRHLHHLSVHMASRDGVLARWSIEPLGEELSAQLTLIGSRGRAVLEMPGDPQAWTFQIGDGPQQTFAEMDEPQSQIQQLASLAAQTQQLREDGSLRSGPAGAESDQPLPPSNWLSACRAIEVSEAAARSLQRGKTIELYYEEHSEEATFKSVMAIGSCGLLSAAFLFLVVGAIIDALLHSGDAPAAADAAPSRAPLLIRLWPFYPFLLLLLLQLLWFVFRNPFARVRQPSASSSEPAD